MINETELRLGNLVEIGIFENNNSLLGTVESISSEFIKVKSNDNIGVFTKELLNPVPVTDEWLNRLCFDYIEHSYRDGSKEMFWQKNYLRVHKDIINNSYLCSMRQPSMLSESNFVCNVEYIHEIQNLFLLVNKVELIK